jgi:1-deoxy-D-xylulose-5-phosphate reductoisomerase
LTSTTSKNIAILGATGSIGRSTLEVVQRLPERFRVTYLTANTNVGVLREQISVFKPKGVVVLDRQRAAELKKDVGNSVEVLSGEEGLCEIVRRDDVDIVVSALVGFAGLRPTIEAIRHKKLIALANKETLVVAGALMTKLVAENGVQLIPIDSEHSAIFQCLVGEDRKNIAKLFLTASGGPFLNTPVEQFSSLSVQQALNHPNWNMGKKITIDSATLMNKGLEVIEAHWLFALPAEKIEIVVHPQSIIHSMVEFVDGSVKAQLGLPDMKLPIQYALTHPERLYLNGGRVSVPTLQSMTFLEPDRKKFRCLQLAYDALSIGGTAPAVLNAANECAVDAFLHQRIPFSRIPELIERALDSHTSYSSPELPQIVEADQATRSLVQQFIA